MKKSSLFGLTWAILACYAFNSNAQTGNWKLAGNSLTGTEILGSLNNFDLNFVTDNIPRITIKGTIGNGNVGIGTTTPGFPLNFANTLGDKISLYGQSGTHYGFGIQNNLFQIHCNSSFNSIAFGYGSSTAFTELMRIKGNGNVGIGTTTPGFPLNFANTLGDKISLYGQSGTHYGFGIQNNLFQIHCNSSFNSIAFGYGSSTAFTELMRIKGNGNVGIGTSTPAYKLDVCGTIRAKEVRVETGWCDYVFDKDYKLRSIDELEKYINENKHLPGIAPASKVEKEGLKVGEMNKAMMEKIEELTLYIIELQKQINELKKTETKFSK